MREIKFKAKLSHSKQWVIGNLVIAQNGQPYIIPSEVFEPDGHHLKIDSDEPYWVDKETISQFTGLTDKSGVEIYEGDKMTVNENVNGTIKPYDVFIKYSGSGFVIYNPDCCNICRDGYGCICSLDEAMCLGKTEIIGNIHDK